MITTFVELKKAVDAAAYGETIIISKNNDFKQAPIEERKKLYEILSFYNISLEYAS